MLTSRESPDTLNAGIIEGFNNMQQEQTPTHPHAVTYFLNDVKKTATEHDISVGEILRSGGLDPATHFLVEVDAQGHEEHEFKDPHHRIKIHEHERFVSRLHGITYFLNDQPKVTKEHELTVAQILQSGDLDPATHFLVEVDAQGHEEREFKDPHHRIKIHEHERFVSRAHSITYYLDNEPKVTKEDALGIDESWSARLWRRTGPKKYKREWCESVRVVGHRLALTYHPTLRRHCQFLHAWQQLHQAPPSLRFEDSSA